jgi:hypothetical protein
MTIEQIVEIPADRRLVLDVPPEIPTGRVILTFSPADTEKQRKLSAFRQLTREVTELSKTDPLPPSFDEILRTPFRLRELAGGEPRAERPTDITGL